MNKKIILLVAVLLIVAVVFVACKGKDDVEGTPETTITDVKESGTENDNKDEFVIGTGEDVVFDDEIVYSEDDLFIGDSENPKVEDSISWDELS